MTGLMKVLEVERVVPHLERRCIECRRTHLNSMTKTMPPVSSTTSTRRPMRGTLNSNRTEPVRPRSRSRRKSICAIQASRCVSNIANVPFFASVPRISPAVAAWKTSVGEAYHARDGLADCTQASCQEGGVRQSGRLAAHPAAATRARHIVTVLRSSQPPRGVRTFWGAGVPMVGPVRASTL